MFGFVALGKSMRFLVHTLLADQHNSVDTSRHDTIHTHGTGCTLSSAIATGWAMGKKERATFAGSAAENIGALSSMHLVDACCIAKAYVNAGIECGRQVR